jgi:hypothetical protein
MSCTEQKRGKWAAYSLALLLGLAAVAATLPIATLLGTGGMFTAPFGDLPVNLIGHMAFQHPGWHWPILLAPDLAWPRGHSIAMTDSNPALSLCAKILASLLGHSVNLLGLWLALCFTLQPVAAVYALRGLIAAAPVPPQNALIAALTMAILSLLLPGYLFRIVHINLMSHFLLLLALGWAARLCLAQKAPSPRGCFAFLTLCVFIHPYLFLFCTALLAAPIAGFVIDRAPQTRDAIRRFALAPLGAVMLFVLANGGIAGGGPGYGKYGSNLLGPFWPQQSGLFGASLKTLDATGYQAESYNYLGAGILLLLACGLIAFWRGRRGETIRRWQGLIMVLAGLTAIAVTPNLTFGSWQLGFTPRALERLFSVLRSSGRAIWPLDYAVLAAAIGLLASRLRPALLAPLALIAIWLQWADTTPLRQKAQNYMSGASEVALTVEMPASMTLFRAAPLCGDEDVVATYYRLAALRAGAKLANMRLAHAPPDAWCHADYSDALTRKLAPGEVRLFMPSAVAAVDPIKIDAICDKIADGLLCREQRLP